VWSLRCLAFAVAIANSGRPGCSKRMSKLIAARLTFARAT
jgi:hypothetical protein